MNRPNFGHRTSNYASSEPSKNLHYYDRSNRKLEKCQQRLDNTQRKLKEYQHRLDKTQRKLKECQSQKKAVEEVAEPWGVRLFHSLKEAKKYDEAKNVYEEILNRREPTKSKDEVIFQLKHLFAAMLMEQKRFQDAEPISKEVWEQRRNCPGPPSEDFKESHRQLCSIFCAVGKYKDAERMHRSMYYKDIKDLWALENGDEVCQRLREQGETKGAKLLQEEVWEERLKQHGHRDGLTIRSGMRLIGFLEQLVATLDNQDGSDAERRRDISQQQAFECEREVVLRKIWDTRLHPEPSTDILNAGHKLGVVCFLQNKFADAEAIFITVWEGKMQRFGNRDPSTVSTGSMLGKTLCRQERPDTYRRAVDILQDIWQTMIKNEDAEVIPCGEDLAQAYSSLGDWPNAESVYSWIFQRKVQRRYPTTEIEDAHWKLGKTLYEQGMGKHNQAQAILGRLYQQWKATPSDPSLTLECGFMLARSLSAQDERIEDALSVARDVFSGRCASLERGSAYLDSGYLYGLLLVKKKRLEEAERILGSVWEHQAQGKEEQELRLKCGYLFGQALIKRQKYSDAKRILEAVAELQGAVSAGVLEIAEIRKLLEKINRLKKLKRNSCRRRCIFPT